MKDQFIETVFFYWYSCSTFKNYGFYEETNVYILQHKLMQNVWCLQYFIRINTEKCNQLVEENSRGLSQHFVNLNNLHIEDVLNIY